MHTYIPRQVKRVLILTAAILISITASAAPVAITATITDSDTTTWSMASWTGQLSAGGPVFTGTTNVSGVLTDSTNFTVGSTYDITICPNAFVNCSFIPGVVISTSAAFQASIIAGITAPRFPASGALHTSFGYTDLELAAPTINDAYFNVVSGVTRYFCGTLGWGTSVCSPTLPGNFTAPTTITDTQSTYPSLTIAGTGDSPLGASIKLIGPGIVGNTQTIIGRNSNSLYINASDGVTLLTRMDNFGNWSQLGNITSGGNIGALGNLWESSTSALPGPTNSGILMNTQVSGAQPSYTNYYNSTYTTNNRTFQQIWFTNCIQNRFVSDDGATAIVPLSMCGGQGTGITGITSNSGSGAWAHTGNFAATGPVNVGPSGGNGLILSGTANGGTPSIVTTGINSNVSLNIGTQGSGGINLNSNTAVTGNFSATGTGSFGNGSQSTALTVNGLSNGALNSLINIQDQTAATGNNFSFNYFAPNLPTGGSLVYSLGKAGSNGNSLVLFWNQTASTATNNWCLTVWGNGAPSNCTLSGNLGNVLTSKNNTLDDGTGNASDLLTHSANQYYQRVTTITASATPAISLVAANGGLQTITLNATATPTITGITVGSRVTFEICQPASGGPWGWNWPAAVHGGMAIGTTASTCSIQPFVSYNGTTLVPESQGISNVAP